MKKNCGRIVMTVLVCCLWMSACGNTPQAPELSEENETVPQETVRISEVMPANKDCLLDEDGDSSDWLELVNIGEETVSLEDCWLSNNRKAPALWRIPAIQMESGERVVIFCSKKNRTKGEYHTNFRLSKEGGEIFLYSPTGKQLDAVSYGPLLKDTSAVFLTGEGEHLAEPRTTKRATPGFPETEEGFEAFLAISDRHGALTINEAVPYNGSYARQHDTYYDWVELKNTSEEIIELGDWFLSDDADLLQKYQLPHRKLKPGETQVIFCSGDSSLGTKTVFHANFTIGSEERLYVSNREGMVSDRVWLYGVPLNGSVGRMENEAGFFYFAHPTPGEENSEGCRTVSGPPAASVKEGVFNSSGPFFVALSGEGDIYYTLDGSVPDSSDTLYREPIRVAETTILRAVCVEKGKIPSTCATFSYILDENDTLPVTSLVCDPEEMFAFSGVWNASRIQDKKCDAAVSFFDTNGAGFSSDCSVELHGAHSRTTYYKKSLELKFSSRYGGDIRYDLFGDGSVTEFHSLLLRGGSMADLDLVRDSFASRLMIAVCPELYPQNVRYTAVYINGEYYGIYAWREAYSEQYFGEHTGTETDEVALARGPVTDGELWDLINYISMHGVRSEKAYAYVADRLDLASLAAWTAVEAYFNNQDINGNIRYVKLGENGKWQVILYDLDYTCVTAKTGWDIAVNAYQLGDIICRPLLSNEAFRELLLETCASLVRRGFTTQNIQSVYDDLLLPLDEVSVRKDCARWGQDYDRWMTYREVLRKNMGEERMADWLSGLQELTKATDEQMRECFPEYSK